MQGVAAGPLAGLPSGGLEGGLTALVLILFLGLVLERALSLVFEHRLWIKYVGEKGAKEFVSLACAYVLCSTYQVDAIQVALGHADLHRAGVVYTALAIAGGSKLGIKLWRDWLGIMSSAARDQQAAKAGGP